MNSGKGVRGGKSRGPDGHRVTKKLDLNPERAGRCWSVPPPQIRPRRQGPQGWHLTQPVSPTFSKVTLSPFFYGLGSSGGLSTAPGSPPALQPEIWHLWGNHRLQ